MTYAQIMIYQLTLRSRVETEGYEHVFGTAPLSPSHRHAAQKRLAADWRAFHVKQSRESATILP